MVIENSIEEDELHGLYIGKTPQEATEFLNKFGNKEKMYELEHTSKGIYIINCASRSVALGGYEDKLWYSFCTESELRRIKTPKTAQDYLLKKRADIVANQTRYYRVYLKMAQQPNWSFEDSFGTSHYTDYIDCLSDENRKKCENICYGDIFLGDVNGQAWCEGGMSFISLFHGLEHFLYFLNLAILEFEEEVPFEVRDKALMIAIRIFRGKESMDFYLDPRGIVPESIHQKLNALVKYEKQFIAGHEFAHHLLGHTKPKKFCEKFLLSSSKDFKAHLYIKSQREELDADVMAVNNLCCSEEEYYKIYTGALLWFLNLQVAEKFPDINPAYKRTHPIAKERYEYFLNHTRKPQGFKGENFEKISKGIYNIKERIKNILAQNPHLLNVYGSLYLDDPNTKWRGKELIDRKDF